MHIFIVWIMTIAFSNKIYAIYANAVTAPYEKRPCVKLSSHNITGCNNIKIRVGFVTHLTVNEKH
jgi:hypothetical protein